jgi:hypothetical protein
MLRKQVGMTGENGDDEREWMAGRGNDGETELGLSENKRVIAV